MTMPNPPTRSHERLLFLGSGVLLLGALIIGLAREQRWGQRFLNLRLVAANANGIRPGQAVQISGMQVGQVRSLEMLPNAKVQVKFQIDERFAPLVGPRSTASQGQQGLVGEHFLVVSPDPQPWPVSLEKHGMRDTTLPYEQPPAISSLMVDLHQTQKALQATLNNTTKLTAEDVPDTLREIRKTLGSVDNLSGVVQRETAATAPTLRKTLTQISATGASAEATSNRAQQVLEQTQPILVNTLKELQELSSISRKLLQLLVGISGLEEAPKDR